MSVEDDLLDINVIKIGDFKPLVHSKMLPWRECVCGCKGFSFKLGEIELWLKNETGAYYTLRAGHEPYDALHGHFSTLTLADQFVRNSYKGEYEKLKKELEVLAPCFGP